jgi:hypothetical protein
MVILYGILKYTTNAVILPRYKQLSSPKSVKEQKKHDGI